MARFPAAHVVESIPYDPRMTPDNVVFPYRDMDCRGCLGNCLHPLEDGWYACVAGLEADKVVAQVRGMLA